ncbi:hypothetical protein [Deminuibacter soli]|uniref:Uncharacterized protein n=1 Tax=Deminuibacter soli TaxID=2291815 RepID=A0A3E1NK33_9BACT|nr:hypothetical protein [Deminuibacter soli]RFM28184.1 hypothetical protein DXN05_11730 [Deminuibacter soli]
MLTLASRTIFRVVCIVLLLFACCVHPVRVQAQSNKVVTTETVIKLMHRNHALVTPDSAHIFLNGYLHLRGMVGNAPFTIELNAWPNTLTAYTFSDSLQSLDAFTVTLDKDILQFQYDEAQFYAPRLHIGRLLLGITADGLFKGYAIDDSLQKLVPCSFREDYSDGSIGMRNLNFRYHGNSNKYPVAVSGDLLFADTAHAAGRALNKLLMSGYNLIGSEGDPNAVLKGYPKPASVKTYKQYTIDRFKAYCSKVIDAAFLVDAAESPRKSALYNDIQVGVILNDGKHLLLQLLFGQADGIAYADNTTIEFTYDVQHNTLYSPDQFTGKLAAPGGRNIAPVVKLLKAARMQAADREEETALLVNGMPAYIFSKGVVLYKPGGNHGNQHFYRYYPNTIIAPLLKK